MEPTKSTRFSGRRQRRLSPTLLLMFFVLCAALGLFFGRYYFFAPAAPFTPTLPTVIPSSTTGTSAPQTPAPETQKESEIGIAVAETLTGLSKADLAAELDDFVTLGVTWVRLDFDWAVIQRDGPNSFDWSRLDVVVAEAQKRNLKLLPILAYAPRWARGNCDARHCPPADVEDFARFAHEAAERYASKGIHTWEIWNEPNARNFWPPSADPARYAHLLIVASKGIKDVDPDAHVILGGLAIVSSSRGNMAPREFLAKMYEAGAGPYFDAVAFHPYSFPAKPSYPASWNAWQQMGNTSPSLRSIMIANGDADKKIWITEYGAPTDGPGDAAALYTAGARTDHVTEEYQREMLLDAISSIADEAWAGPLFWYSYKDLSSSQDSAENFYGLLRADGSHKPAYDALRDLLK